MIASLHAKITNLYDYDNNPKPELNFTPLFLKLKNCEHCSLQGRQDQDLKGTVMVATLSQIGHKRWSRILFLTSHILLGELPHPG